MSKNFLIERNFCGTAAQILNRHIYIYVVNKISVKKLIYFRMLLWKLLWHHVVYATIKIPLVDLEYHSLQCYVSFNVFIEWLIQLLDSITLNKS